MENKIENYTKARTARKENKHTIAHELYKEILASNPNSIEAEFYIIYHDAINSKVENFWSAAISIMNIEKKIFYSIKNNEKEREQDEAIQCVFNDLCNVSNKFVTETWDYYIKLDQEIKENFISVFVSTLSAATEILYICGDELENEFGNKYSSYSVLAWEKAIEDNCDYVRYVTNQTDHLNTINKYSDKIRIYEKEYKNPPIKTFIKPDNFINNVFKRIKGAFK